jgi:hypothetical protein
VVIPRFSWLARQILSILLGFLLGSLLGFYLVFSQVQNPRCPGFSMVTSAFPKDSEVPVFQKSQVSCQVLSLQKNQVIWGLLGFYLVYYLVLYYVTMTKPLNMGLQNTQKSKHKTAFA